MLIWSFVFFAIYVTMVPFSFVFNPHFIIRRFGQIEWIPFMAKGRFAPRSDIVANIIFFMPFGILLALRKILTEYRNLRAGEWIRILLQGASLSAFVEFLQIFTYDRESSVTDILTNTTGTLLGAFLMLAIYLRFHEEIKSILFTLFARKPEMIMAGLFILVIYLAQSAPFTYSIQPDSIAHQVAAFLRHPLRVENLFNDLLSGIILYGSFTFFLFAGLERYFSSSLKKMHYFLVLLLSLFLPLFIEIYQLLVPVRNHSLGDVFIAQLSVLFGAALYWNLRRDNRKTSHQAAILNGRHFSLHIRFFKIMGYIYLLFVMYRILFPVDFVPNIAFFKEVLQTDNVSTYYLIRYHRLDLVISIVREVFAFLPAGFILSLMWFLKKNRQIASGSIWAAAILIPSVFFFSGVLFARQDANWFEIPSAAVGIWLGFACWQLYIFMLGKRN